MSRKYITIDLTVGSTLESAVNSLLAHALDGKLARCVFNGVELFSDTVTLDNAYMAVTGGTKEEFDARVAESRLEFQKAKAEHEANKGGKIKHLQDLGRQVLPEDKWAEWDEIVPIRMESMYFGMELECCLAVIIALHVNRGNKKTFEDAKIVLDSQGHNGMSFSIVCSLLVKFSPWGEEFVSYVLGKE